jgi:hypothetical protein
MYLMDAATSSASCCLHQFRKLHYEVAGSLAQISCRRHPRPTMPRSPLMPEWKERSPGTWKFC